VKQKEVLAVMAVLGNKKEIWAVKYPPYHKR